MGKGMVHYLPVTSDVSAAWLAEPAPIRAALVRTSCGKPPTNTHVAAPGVIWEGPTEFGLALIDELDKCGE